MYLIIIIISFIARSVSEVGIQETKLHNFNATIKITIDLKRNRVDTIVKLQNKINRHFHG